jgi:ribosomal subunit interface protein
MRTQITTRHCDISSTVRTQAEELASKLEKFDPRITSVDFVFREQKRERSVEVTVKADRLEPVHAEADSDDFRDALDSLTSRITRIIRNRREKSTDRQGPRRSEQVPVAE